VKTIRCLLFVSLVYSQIAAPACLLNMGYKYGAKLPLINLAPDNNGAYLELFTIAASKIGCELNVVRTSKKRLHLYFNDGSLDFYPGASYSKERRKYLYYIENGFDTSEYGITPLGYAEIEGYQQVKKLGLTWLQEIGSSKKGIANSNNIQIMTLNSVSIKVIQRLFAKDRAQFAVIDKELYDYYLKTNNIKTLKSLGLKIHKNCCGGNKPMYLGFSRFSSHYSETVNTSYNSLLPITAENDPKRPTDTSIAYQLQQALIKMKHKGTIDKIYRKYFLGD